MEGHATKLTKKQHLLGVMKQKGKAPQELKAWLNRPEFFMYLWEWLEELAFPLSFTELAAWQSQTGRHLSKWEVRAMTELDKVRSHG